MAGESIENRRVAIWLVVVLVVGFLLRAYALHDQSFNMDEAYELANVRTPTADLVVAHDSMPPLYPLILKGWLELSGTDIAARWLSVLFGMGTLVGVWLVGAELFDRRVAVTATLLCAILPIHIFYSQQVRTYSLLIMLVALTLWFAVRAIKRNRWSDWLAMVVLAALCAYAHYFAAIFLMLLCLLLAIELRGKLIAKKPLIAIMLLGLLCLPLQLLLRGDMSEQASGQAAVRTFNPAVIGYSYLSLFTGYCLGPSKSDLQTMGGKEAAIEAIPWALPIFAAVCLFTWQSFRKERLSRHMVVLIILVLSPVIVAVTLCNLVNVNYHVRHVAWIAVPLCLFLSVGASRAVRHGPGRIAIGVLIASCLAFCYNRHHVAKYQNEDLGGAVAYLVDQKTGRDTVFILSDYLHGPVSYYAKDELTLRRLPIAGQRGQVVETEHDVETVLQTIAEACEPGEAFWLIYSRPYHGDPQGLLYERLQAMGMIELAKPFAGAQLYRGEFSRP